jgi:hypothetical protein
VSRTSAVDGLASPEGWLCYVMCGFMCGLPTKALKYERFHLPYSQTQLHLAGTV